MIPLIMYRTIISKKRSEERSEAEKMTGIWYAYKDTGDEQCVTYMYVFRDVNQ